MSQHRIEYEYFGDLCAQIRCLKPSTGCSHGLKFRSNMRTKSITPYVQKYAMSGLPTISIPTNFGSKTKWHKLRFITQKPKKSLQIENMFKQTLHCVAHKYT